MNISGFSSCLSLAYILQIQLTVIRVVISDNMQWGKNELEAIAKSRLNALSFPIQQEK